MDTLIQFLTENWPTLLAVFWALLSVANGITKLTETEKDDAVVAKIIDLLSFLPKSNASGSLKLPLTKSKTQE